MKQTGHRSLLDLSTCLRARKRNEKYIMLDEVDAHTAQDLPAV
jgi:hypothetical protein